MAQVFLKLFNMSISAGWVILAVLVLRLVLKRAPKNYRLILWAAVGFRLVCPFTLESVLSLIPSAQTVPAEVFWVQTPQVNTGVTELNSVINPVLETTMATEGFNSAPPMFLLFYFFSYLWMGGLAVLALYGIISYLLLRRRVAPAVRLRENIWLCDHIPTPFILGWIRPKIYLPSGLPQEQHEAVIAHEQAHLKRLDHWIKLLGFVLLSAYWFNPLVWVAYILLCRDIELACDERVIRGMDSAQKKEYSETLLACGTQKHRVTACPLAFGEVGVKSRIKAVLNYKKPGFWIMILAGIVCAVVAVCFLTDPIGSTDDNDQIWGEQWVNMYVYDTIKTDIDDDGAIERCVIGPGPTFGVRSYELSVWDGDECEDAVCFLFNAEDVGFAGMDGKIFIVGTLTSWESGGTVSTKGVRCEFGYIDDVLTVMQDGEKMNIQTEKWTASFDASDSDYLNVRGGSKMYRYHISQQGVDGLTIDHWLTTFHKDNGAEGDVWTVYSVAGYPDLSIVLLSSGVDSKLVYELIP